MTTKRQNAAFIESITQLQNAAFIESITQLQVMEFVLFYGMSYLIIEDPVATVKCRTVINTLFNCFNVCLSVK